MNSVLLEQVLEMAVTIQQIPAPPFGESQRAAFVHQQFAASGLAKVSMDALGNVYGCIPGSGKARPVVISAHLDTVFPASTDLKVQREGDKIYGPGIGDNSLGVAGLLGLHYALQSRKSRLDGDIWLAANVGEEGLGDLRGMRAVVQRFAEKPLAYIILEGMALGQVYTRALGVQRYRIQVCTPGGHSWADYGRPSAIQELSCFVARLGELPVPSRPRTSRNVGVIAGGTSINTIAAEAHLELDLRSEGARELEDLTAQVEEMVRAANRPEVKFSYEIIGRRPAGSIAPEHPLVTLAQRCLREQGVQPNLHIGSTDANIPLSQGLPAICIGLSTGDEAHTVREYIHTPPLGQGLAQLVNLVSGVFQLPG